MATHCDENDPNPCFKCKLEYWRTEKTPLFKYTYGQDTFHGPTDRERLAETLKAARAQGIEPERYDP